MCRWCRETKAQLDRRGSKEKRDPRGPEGFLEVQVSPK